MNGSKGDWTPKSPSLLQGSLTSADLNKDTACWKTNLLWLPWLAWLGDAGIPLQAQFIFLRALALALPDFADADKTMTTNGDISTSQKHPSLLKNTNHLSTPEATHFGRRSSCHPALRQSMNHVSEDGGLPKQARLQCTLRGQVYGSWLGKFSLGHLGPSSVGEVL